VRSRGFLVGVVVALAVIGILVVARGGDESGEEGVSSVPMSSGAATTAAGSASSATTSSKVPVVTPPDTTVPDTTPPAPERLRVLIDTDLGGGIEGDGGVRGDADDVQSLVRAIHYSDLLGIEGIVSTEAPGSGDPDVIREWIRRTDVDHLRDQGYTDLMTESELLDAVKTGTRQRRGPRDGGSTEGSRFIIERAHAGSEDDPLWVLVWGSMGTVAQALYDDPSIVSKIRIYSIGDFNSRANLDARNAVVSVLDDHPELWWVENAVLPFQSRSTYRGVFEGGNQRGQWDPVAFVARNIRDHGTDADGEFPQKLGDAFPGATGPRPVRGGLKEGDSPTLLYLLSPTFGGIGDLDDPTQPSWGGRFRRSGPDTPNYYVDIDCSTTEECARTINRHRVDFLSHWRDRWDRYDRSDNGSS